jgi:PAT family beta-lactamase induction signal transducer AmpG
MLLDDTRSAPPALRIERRTLPPLAWVPTSYLAEGIPYAMVMGASATMLKDLGHTDGEITLATASIGIAWSLKPLWAAFLDRYLTKKIFVIAMELAMAALLAIAALSLRLASPSSSTAAVVPILWAIAFASATQDICVDGVYVTSLDEERQAAWIGVQGVAWNAGKIFATAVVVWLAGTLERLGRAPRDAWMCALLVAAAAMLSLAAWHAYALPTGARPRAASAGANDTSASSRRIVVAPLAGLALGAIVAATSGVTIGVILGLGTSCAIAVGWRDHVPPFVDFFRKKSIWGMLTFVVLYRTGEGFLLQEAPLFMQARLAAGGLGLSLEQKAWIDGTISTSVSLLAGLLGGVVTSKLGLRRALVALAIAMNVPHVCYVYLSWAGSPEHPLSLATVEWLVTIEKFGYSFGCVGLMLYMMQQLAPGKYKMTHYAFATALMNVVLVPTQALSGPLADWLGYKTFFLFVTVVSIPSIAVAWLAPFPTRAETPADMSPRST